MVELEKTIGYTTSIGEITRESGSIIGKKVAEFKPSLIDLELLTDNAEDDRAQAEYFTHAA